MIIQLVDKTYKPYGTYEHEAFGIPLRDLLGSFHRNPQIPHPVRVPTPTPGLSPTTRAIQ